MCPPQPAAMQKAPTARGRENVRMHLWLFRGQPPTDGREVEVVVSRFAFLR